MEKIKIIVAFESGLTPKKALSQEYSKLSLQLNRLHSINEIVNNYRQLHESISNSYENDELLFQEEIFYTLSTEEQNIYSVYISDFLEIEEAAEAFMSLEQNLHVKYVQYDEENKLYNSPNDPYFNQQWGLQKINCEQAWNYSKGENILIALVDSGIDYNNQDIVQNLWKDSSGNYGYDFSNNDYDTMDSNGHGTHVAGIIGALSNNLQIVGVAPKITILSVKIFPNAYDSICSKAIKYAVDKGARVINNSWGPPKRRPSNRVIEEAIDYAYSKGVISVFAAGNDNDDVKYYSPANHPNVIAVGSTNNNDSRSPFSNYGDKVKVSAPGSNILSLGKNSNTPVFMSGTSMSAPFVAGTIGLIFSINPNTTSTDVLISKLVQYSDLISTDKPIGKRLNAGNIVFNDPSNFKLFEESFADTHRGVTGCCDNVQDQAWTAATRWHNKIKQQNPDLIEVYRGHGAGRADCSSGQRDWPDNSRWCRSTIHLRAYIMMRKK